MDTGINADLLEDSLAKIERARNWSPRVISKLENSVRSANDEDLFRLNPIRWAHEKNVDEHEAIDLFLHSAKAGLFQMDWNVICPCCGLVTHSLRNLHGLRSRNVCTVCFRDDRATLDDYVQITFSVSPSVRDICFNHPEALSVDEYCFQYLFVRGAKYGPGFKLTLREFLQFTQKHFAPFLPGEKVTVETELQPGGLMINDLISQKGFAFIVSGEPRTEPQTISVKLTGDQFDVPLPPIRPSEIQVGQKLVTSQFFYALRPGKVVLQLEQASPSKALLCVWGASYEEMGDNPDIQFEPCLSAKELFACQTFHDLFRSEVFQETQGFGVKDVTFLFTDLKSSTQLYNQIGDLNAFARVREHYGVLNTAILNQHGAVVKTIGDAVMATFTQPPAAVRAGLEMLHELRKLNTASQNGDLVLKVGIHRGAAISVTLNDRLDYFGETVNIAARVQGLAGGDEIYVTDEVYRYSGVPELLQQRHCQVEPMQIELKGILDAVKVYKVSGLD